VLGLSNGTVLQQSKTMLAKSNVVIFSEKVRSVQ